MRWPSLFSRRGVFSTRDLFARDRASKTPARSGCRGEPLEPRHMLSADAGGHLIAVDSPLDGFSRFNVALEKAADLSRYSAAELNAVREWIALTPQFFDWVESGYQPIAADDGGSTSTGSSASQSQTMFGPQPLGSADSSVATFPSIGATTIATTSSSTTTSTSSLAAVESIDRFPGAELWRFPVDVGWQPAAAELQSSIGEGHFYPLVGHKMASKFVPNDPFYPDQWHLNNRRQTNGVTGEDANVIEAWDQYRGTGVVIGVVDNGVDYFHPDLTASYLPNLSVDYADFDNDPLADPFNEDFHGTAVAGVAAAPGNNGVGISGVAPGSRFAAIRLTSAANQSDNQEALSLSHMPDDIDIYNNSWGPVDGLDWLFAAGPLAYTAMDQGVRFGRGGRGSIYTWAAGNGLQDGDNVNYDGYANLYQTIAVTAIDDRGKQAEYAEPGAAILISAPSSSLGSGIGDGIVTTDLRGTQGYNYAIGSADGDGFSDLNYTETFGGTSSATPVVSGVVALMLEANPNLSWRDVQSILVETARKNDPNDNGWRVNAAGYEFNHKYGFGAVDALAAVQLAENWTPRGPAQILFTPRIFSGALIPENATGITSTFAVADDFPNIEFVEVFVDINHNYGGDLEIVLTSPAGTRSVLATRHDDGTPYQDWFLMSNFFRGEGTQGEWKLTIYDRDSGITGSLRSWGMNFVLGPDVAPVAVDDTAQTRPGVPVDIDVADNDAGHPDDTSVAIVGAVTGGTATVLPSGQIRFTPAAGFSGDATLRYTISSLGGLVSNQATVTIVVNEPPTARPDSVTTPEDTTGTFNVALNDTDIDGTIAASTVTITSDPQHGTATVDLQGRIVYTPGANYNGPDSLQYTVADNRGGVSGPGLVTINVTPVNDPPTPVDDTAKGVGGVATIVDVLANDFDIDSTIDPGTVQIVTPPTGGSAVVNPSGTISVTPPLGFSGLLTFTYAVRDNQGALSAPGTVRITTSAPPTTTPDSLTINEDTVVTIDVLLNDFDVDGFIVRSTLAVSQQPMHGTATVDSATQRIRYVPEMDYFGIDTFRYTVRDNEGNTSAPGVVTITLIEVNDAPRGSLDAAGTETGVGVVIDVLANDVDVDGTIQPFTLAVPVGGRPQHGDFTIDPVTGAIFYVPTADYVGSDALTYFVRDEDGALSNETTVLLRVGRPVSFSGMVFADINNNGLHDAGEVGVPNAEVAAVMNDGLFRMSATVRTEDDGTFVVVDRPSEGIVLPQGTYTLRQAQPVAFIDGKDTPGVPPPTATTNNAFVGITLAQGEEATDYYFAERGLRAEFVTAYLGRRIYFASAAPDGSLFGARHGRVFDLHQGDVYFTFDGGAPGLVTATATFDNTGGSVRLDVLDANLNVLNTSNSQTGSVSVAFGPGPGPYILRLSGAGQNVFISAATADATPWVGATLSLRGSLWSGAVSSQSSSSTATTAIGGGTTQLPTQGFAADVAPWSNVDAISIRFDSPVSIGSAGLRIAAASGETYGVRNYIYDAAARTATWWLDRSLAADNYVVSAAPLGTSVDFHASTFAPQEVRFSVLPGDVNGDGAANYLDAIAVRNNFATAATYSLASPRYDLNANGVVDAADVALAVVNGFARRSGDEISGTLLTAIGTTVGGSAAAEAIVRRANLGSSGGLAASPPRILQRRERIAAVDTALDVPLSTASALRAHRARRSIDAQTANDDGELLSESSR
ncbi:MAG: tandem-95 repeat protein [Pirellulales bacterium]